MDHGATVQALPPLVLLQVLVLGPIALLCVYGIATRIGGRLLGYWASFLWVAAPFASIPLFVDRYQERWAEHFLRRRSDSSPWPISRRR